jgi:hypothetical protein
MPTAGVVALCLMCIIAGVFGGLAYLAPEPIDGISIYCEAAADGWMAAHQNLYKYLERIDPVLFEANFRPITAEGWNRLVNDCLANPLKVRDALNNLLSEAGIEKANAPQG